MVIQDGHEESDRERRVHVQENDRKSGKEGCTVRIYDRGNLKAQSPQNDGEEVRRCFPLVLRVLGLHGRYD